MYEYFLLDWPPIYTNTARYAHTSIFMERQAIQKLHKQGLDKIPKLWIEIHVGDMLFGERKTQWSLRSLRYFPGNDKLHEKSNIRSLFRTKSNIYDEVFRTL